MSEAEIVHEQSETKVVLADVARERISAGRAQDAAPWAAIDRWHIHEHKIASTGGV